MSARLICHLAAATHLGGAERSLLEAVCASDDERYRQWVILPKEDGPLVRALAAAGVAYDVLPMPPAFLQMSRATPGRNLALAARAARDFARYLGRLRALVRRRRPAVLHTNGIKPHFLGALVAGADTPLVWHLRDILPPGQTRSWLRRVRALKRAHVIACSLAAARAFDPALDGVSVVHNGIDALRYARAPQRHLHERLGLPPSTPLVGIVGVLARWKGQRTFIEMAARLVARGAPAHFVIVGSQIYDSKGEQSVAEALLAHAAALGVQERVHLIGFQPDPAQLMNGLDVLVHASVEPEPFGRVVVEAMACGVPTVAAAAGGVLEIVRHRETGLLYPPGDVDLLAGCVERLLDDERLRQRLAAAAHEDVLARFTLGRHVAGLRRVYDTLLAA